MTHPSFVRISRTVAVVSLGFATLAGCGSADSAGSMGAVTGGAQDEALAEEKIASGSVPDAADITVEGMLSSHDLPLAANTCEKPLCINSAYAVAPTLDYENSAVFVQIGFSSGIDEATFAREPLNLSVVVDRSGSMSGEKIAAVKSALTKLIGQLDENDRLSIVEFDDAVDVLLPSTKVTDKSALIALVSDIFVRGATDLSAGLTEGLAQVYDYVEEADRSSRVMVFTDAIANTGDTDTADFVALASEAAESDIGLTVFGVGTDLNQELVLAISKLRGGNYFYLADADRIATVFDEDFDYLVTPLAYDLKFVLTPATGFTISQVYGFPSFSSASASFEIDVSTVFLSRGHGAVVARLEPTGAWPSGSAPLAGLTLTYEPADGTDNPTETFETIYDGTDPLGNDCQFFSQIAVRKTVAYVNAAIGMRDACALYWDGDTDRAVALLDDTETLLTDEAAATNEAGLEDEAALVAALRGNMETGSSATSDYYDDDQTSEGMYVGCAFVSAHARSRTATTANGVFAVTLLGWLLRKRRGRVSVA